MPNPYDALHLSRQVCFPLYVVSKEVIRLYTPLLEPLGITYTQYLVFMALWEKDGISVSELGEKVFLDSGTLTPLLKKMESKNWITRCRNKNNERMVTITLTKEGWELRDHALHIPHEILKMTALSKKELETLYHLLYRFMNHTKEDNGSKA